MRILVVYASKHNTTEECAKYLEKCLNKQEVTLCRVDNNADIPNIHEIEKYDIVIFGSNIRMTKINGKIKEYLNKNADTLKSMKCGYFLCCGFTDCFEDYLYKNIPEILIENSLSVACFGGRIDPSRARGMDKFILKSVRSNILGGGADGRARDDISLPTIMEGNISQFADKILGK